MENSKYNPEKINFKQFLNENIEMQFIKSFLSFDIIKLSLCLSDDGLFIGLTKNDFLELINSIFKINKKAKIEYNKNYSDKNFASEIVHSINIISKDITTEFNLFLTYKDFKIIEISSANSFINEDDFDFKQLYN
jgi:hypothetical protein